MPIRPDAVVVRVRDSAVGQDAIVPDLDGWEQPNRVPLRKTRSPMWISASGECVNRVTG
jgi:hypothetical protein